MRNWRHFNIMATVFLLLFLKLILFRKYRDFNLKLFCINLLNCSLFSRVTPPRVVSRQRWQAFDRFVHSVCGWSEAFDRYVLAVCAWSEAFDRFVHAVCGWSEVFDRMFTLCMLGLKRFDRFVHAVYAWSEAFWPFCSRCVLGLKRVTVLFTLCAWSEAFWPFWSRCVLGLKRFDRFVHAVCAWSEALWHPRTVTRGDQDGDKSQWNMGFSFFCFFFSICFLSLLSSYILFLSFFPSCWLTKHASMTILTGRCWRHFLQV